MTENVKIIRALVAAGADNVRTKTAARSVVSSVYGRKPLPGGASRDAVADMVLDLAAKFRAIQAQRFNNRSRVDHFPPMSERLTRHRERMACRLAISIKQAIRYYPERGDLEVDFGGDGRGETVGVTVDAYSVGRYSSRCHYNKMSYHAHVWCDPRSTVSIVDGVVMLVSPGGRRRVNGLEVVTGHIISRVHGGFREIITHPAVCVTRGDVSAHGDNLASAIKSLRRKIAVAVRRAAPLTLDTVLTPAAYQRITGACDAGTNSWLAAHGLDRRARMTVREALAVIEPGEWGRDKLAALVGE